MIFTSYTAMYLVAALMSAVAGVFAWRRRSAPGGIWLCLTSVATTSWALAEACDYSSLTLSTHVLWAKVSYLGATTAPVFLLIFVQAYIGHAEWTQPRMVAYLLSVPIFATAAAFTNGLHHQVWTGFLLLPNHPYLIVYYHGIVYWVVTMYGLALGLIASVQLLVIAVRARTLYRSQSIAVMIAVLIPWCAELGYSLAPGALLGIDPAVALAFTSSVLTFAMLRFRLLDVVPVPRAVLVEEMTDGLLVLDRDRRVLEINPAGIRLLGIEGPVKMGDPIAAVLSHWLEAVETMFSGADSESFDTRLSRDGVHLSVHRLLLRDDGRGREREMLMLRNVTEQALVEQELKEAVSNLQTRMTEIEALQAELREQAICDPLTGLNNRRFFAESFERELGRAAREGYSVSLVMFDIDHFKMVNDTLGHAAGDAVLLALGAELRAQTRIGDVACRYGGDEFLVMLPNTSLEVAVQFAERWRETWRGRMQRVGISDLHSALSLGVASFPEHGTTCEGIIHAADTAVYAAKTAGRDRVCVAQAVPEDGSLPLSLPPELLVEQAPR